MSLSGQMFSNESEKIKRFRELEHDQISLNRWYLGEKWKRPVDWYEAEWHFIWNFRKEWLETLRASGEYPYD